MVYKTTLLAATLAGLASAGAAATVYQSSSPANNAAVRSDWLTAIGGSVDTIQDWETGFTDEQRVTGSVGNGLTVSGVGIGGTGAPKIEGGAGSIGNSNPIGSFALELNDVSGTTLTLVFEAAISYLGFLTSDHGTGTISWGAGSTLSPSTGASGNSSEFTGIAFDLGENVTTVTFADFSGSAGWGIDNIEYGFVPMSGVPVPAALPLLAFALGGLGLMRRRTRS